MTVRYQSTEADALAAYLRGSRDYNGFGLELIRLGVALWLGVFLWENLFAESDLFLESRSVWPMIGACVVLSAVSWGLIRILTPISRRLSFPFLLKSNYFAMMLGELEVTLNEAGVTEVYPNGSIFTAWPAVKGVKHVDGYLEIRLDSSYRHWIPNSAFASPAEGAAFAAYALERIQAAKAT